MHLNYDLFFRTPAKGIHATASGQVAVQTSHEFLEQLRHFEAELVSIGGEAGGTIRIARFVTAVGSFMPPILRKFQRANPNIEIQLHKATMEGLVDLLDDGLADMAFTYSDVVGPAHIFEPLVAVPPHALLARNNPLSRQDDVILTELAAYPMMLFDLPRTTGYYLRFMTDAGHDVHVSHRTGSVEMVRTLVANGFGFSILNARPPEYAKGKSRFRVVPIREDLTSRAFGIVRQSGIRQPLIVRRFIDLCNQFKDQHALETMIVSKHSGKKLRNKVQYNCYLNFMD